MNNSSNIEAADKQQEVKISDDTDELHTSLGKELHEQNTTSFKDINTSSVISRIEELEESFTEEDASMSNVKDAKCTNIKCMDSDTENTDKLNEITSEQDVRSNAIENIADINATEGEQFSLLTEFQQSKVDKIRELLQSSIVDVAGLQELAVQEHGFVTDAVRQQVWPRLLHVDNVPPIPLLDREQASGHHYYSQVVLDVERTLKRFPPGISSERRKVLMDQLIRMIVTVLKRNPDMHYYQGYHDVGITFLLVCGEDAGVLLLEELSLTHLREFLQPTMERTQRWLAFIYPILATASPALYQHMLQSGVGTVFCLAWLITWYAHTLSHYRHVVRLYDFLLSSPPLMPMYVAAAILNCREQQLLAVECDMAMMHHALSQVPDDLPLDSLLQEAKQLYRQVPPPTIAEKVDHYLLQQKQQEEAEMLEREQRKAAAARARDKCKPRPHVSWASTLATFVPRNLYTVRGAGAVAVIAVVMGLTAFYCKNQGHFKMLQLPW
uniref:TBC1 domain family member 20-like n=1 Tax=Hirondellea gigas TaxID=1518452 RepID=A0A2P2HXJ2_9CRUS